MPTELSLVVPFYDEAGNAEGVVRGLTEVFEAKGIDYELVLVDNGSADGTADVVRGLNRENPRIKLVTLPRNAGYGGGILAGLAQATGRYIGYAWGDDQVRADDVFRVFDALRSDDLDFCKAVRVVREDGFERRLVSWIYNGVFGVLFPVRSRDVNACPKIFRAEALGALQPASLDWFLDAELMIKARRRGLRGSEVPVTYHRRRWGRSHVRLFTILEFVWNILRHRIRGV